MGFLSSLCYRLLPQALRAYRAKYPHVELQLAEMDTSHQIREIEDHRLDVGFIGLGQSSEKLSELQTALVAKGKALCRPAAEPHIVDSFDATDRSTAPVIGGRAVSADI